MERIDDRFTVGAGVRFAFGPFGISLVYSFTKNASTAEQIFSYTRHVAGLELGLRL